MDYLALKAVHVASAAISLSGFALRGALMLRGSAWLETRFARTAPHAIDTVLLASAIALAWLSGQSPLAQGWLGAKVLALFAYIVLGSIALRHGRTRRMRAIAYAMALATALYIVSVAMLRTPAGFFALGKGFA